MKLPEYIYHYTKAENLFKILPEMKLRLSSPRNTNDPLEILRTIELELHNSCEVISECLDQEELIQENKFTIACFTSDSECSKGYDRPSMWVHYGGNFSGACIKIDCRVFLEKNNNIQDFYQVSYKNPEEFIQRLRLNSGVTSNDITKTIIFQKRRIGNTKMNGDYVLYLVMTFVQ